MTEYSRALGECIYQNRKRRKLTQAELAECSEAQIEALIPIVRAAVDVFQGELVPAIK